jgi:Homeodomain-like domain
VNKKYVVELTRAERERLLKLASSGTAPARMLNRARVLLKADADGPDRWTDERIARALDTSVATVGRVRKRFCRQGLEAALERSLPDRVYERSLDGRAEARLIALACSEAPEGRDRWSMRLLADKAVELGIVENSVSHEMVRKTLKKTSSVPTSSKGG